MRSLILALACLAIATPAWADQGSAIAAVRQQNKVMDAAVDTGGTMYVSVKPEKLPWDQLAQHICRVVRPHEARIFKVKVVDITTVFGAKKPAEWRQLAEASCGR